MIILPCYSICGCSIVECGDEVYFYLYFSIFRTDGNQNHEVKGFQSYHEDETQFPG